MTLRVLEYYEGVLFLTTNRVGVFDEAFYSQIHMALYYPPWEWKYTKRIWGTHLKKLQASGLIEVDDQDILEYAETNFEKQAAKCSPVGPVWNGRQIRNAFQSAVALAGFKHQGGKIRLEREHFERVSKVSNEFNHYVWSIKCQSDAEKAEMGLSIRPHLRLIILDKDSSLPIQTRLLLQIKTTATKGLSLEMKLTELGRFSFIPNQLNINRNSSNTISKMSSSPRSTPAFKPPS
ncbi:hypothetical protein B0T22DRAFT_481419 [Podospora appendiculata]|uniref:AAA+ ATPase lid domain-containing protein n=1 Tax=Podospora appendiculata TaxID=314037 RepID=A0AAE1CEA7_9PEZI|nr:hypothetical protein B0T22DRAFT_481419 [Podospora appendiculata]